MAAQRVGRDQTDAYALSVGMVGMKLRSHGEFLGTDVDSNQVLSRTTRRLQHIMFGKTAAYVEDRIARADIGGFRNPHRQTFGRGIERICAVLPVPEIQVATRFA